MTRWPALPAESDGRVRSISVLIATVRPKRVSVALYTSPMPPAPSADRIS